MSVNKDRVINQELGDAKIERDEVQNKRKELWRQDSNYEQSLNTSKEQLDEAERQLRSTVSKVSVTVLTGTKVKGSTIWHQS